MPINKVIFGDTTLIDLSGDTIYSTDEVASGITYHDRWGDVRTGTLQPPTTIRPSNASPPAMNTSATYKVATSGYAIASPPNLLLDTTGEGQALTAGRIYYDFDEDGGYFFHEKPSGNLVETLLWTNPSPTSSFSAQTITLSQSIENFDYIKISYRAGTTNTNEISAIYSVTDIKKMLDSNHIWGATMGVNSSGHYGRYITFDSNTTLAFSSAYNLDSTGNTSNVAYPTRVFGVKKSSSGGTKGAKGTFTASTSQNTTVEIGFLASCIYVYCTLNDTVVYPSADVYLSDGRTKIGYDCIHYGDGGNETRYNLGSTTNARIYSVDSTSFTITKAYDARYTHYTYYAVE